ncbi:hypothetical protein JYT74_00795 [Crocinitomix catalasitica]|nr:hypothetical protein [Crocinitomix catalasitica]
MVKEFNFSQLLDGEIDEKKLIESIRKGDDAVMCNIVYEENLGPGLHPLKLILTGNEDEILKFVSDLKFLQ